MEEAAITARELTVEEIRGVLSAWEKQEGMEPHVLTLLFPERAPVEAVVLSTGMSLADLSGLTPSRMDKVLQAVEEANPFFVEMVRRLAEFGRAVLEKRQA